MKTLIKISILCFLNLLQAHCGGCNMDENIIHSHTNKNEIASIIMNELYGNYNLDTKESNRNLNKYDNAKLEGILDYNNNFYIAVISIDQGHNQGLNVYQTTFTIENNVPLIINSLELIRSYPNRYGHFLNELVEIEYGNKNIGFKVISQYGQRKEHLGLLAVFDNKLELILDNIYYSYDASFRCEYEVINGEIFVDGEPFLEWKNNSSQFKNQEWLTPDTIADVWTECKEKSVVEFKIIETGKLFNDIIIDKNIFSFTNLKYEITD